MPLLVTEKQLFGKSRVLAPEHDIAPVGIFHVGVAVLRLGREEKALPVSFREKVLKAVVVAYIQIMPIVQPRAFELLIGRLEAHGLDDVQPSSRDCARARDISRVLRYLRFAENDIKLQTKSPPLLTVYLIIITQSAAYCNTFLQNNLKKMVWCVIIIDNKIRGYDYE